MKNVVSVCTDNVCEMKNKSNYIILDSEKIQDYIRKYVTSIISQEDNVIKRINEDYNTKKFFIELLYDGSSLSLYEIMFDDDLKGFDFINTDKNNVIFFNYKKSDLKLRFELLRPLEYHTTRYNYRNYVCLNQLTNECMKSKVCRLCTKYK